MLMTFGFSLFGAISVTSPSSAVTVKAADDYATRAFQDPWDMNEQTDLGWFIYDTTSGSKSNLKNIVFSGGKFIASSTNTDPNIYILETGLGVSGTANLGKIGPNYKIDADKYKIFVVRMKLNKNHDGMLMWSRNTIYNDLAYTKTPFSTYNGWGIYIVNIPNLGYGKLPGKAGYPWAGDIDSLRFDPASAKVDIQIDWIRLVENDSSLYRTVRWNGNSGEVDIYLDDDRNSGNGTLGVVAKGVSGTSYSLYAGALEPNVKYYVGVKNASGGSISYSSGYYMINDIPYVQFTAPSPEGGDDFATVEMSDAWDMNKTGDLDSYAGLTGAPSITSVTAETQPGDYLGSTSVLKGTSSTVSSGAGDPILSPLWFDGGRGATYNIDSSKYRIMVLKMGLPGAWDLVNGSVARIYWHVKGEFNGNSIEKMNQSADVIVRHKAGNIVINTIIADLKKMPLENSPSSTGWNGIIDGFRIDPHEFPGSKSFYIKEVKIAAFERADESYTIKWNYTDSIATSSTLSLYYDTNNSGYNGTAIAGGINPAAGKYTWNTSRLAEGTYYIYLGVSDGRNSNKVYAPWPIVIDHSDDTGGGGGTDPTGKISLSRTGLRFGSVSGKVTDPQKFAISNTGTGTMNWTVSTNKSWLSASPSTGSNSGFVTVSVNGSSLSKGTYTGTVTVSSSDATNSPRTVSVTLNVFQGGTTGKPFGDFATPVSNTIVRSSIPVTGWVLDDIGVQSVKLYNGSKLIGNAVFVEGARPDIESSFPEYPRNHLAGWGYMMLTNFLPNRDATYTIIAKATDKEGNVFELGRKTITVDNDSAVKPFGAIETPDQGGSVSGKSFTNWGWVLTPPPNKIPTSGSTINVLIDSVSVGNPDYGYYRKDIADLFPTHLNKDAAFGYFTIDTTKYDNGVHTIQWQATDNGGNRDGIGSRYFTVENTGSRLPAQGNSVAFPSGMPDVILERPAGRIAHQDLMKFSHDTAQPVDLIRGFNDHAAPTLIYPNPEGITQIQINQMSRVILSFNAPVEGYLEVGGQLRPLPTGSTLHSQEGKFYWSPAPAFLGEYQFVFVDRENQTFKKINIIIQPYK